MKDKFEKNKSMKKLRPRKAKFRKKQRQRTTTQLPVPRRFRRCSESKNAFKKNRLVSKVELAKKYVPHNLRYMITSPHSPFNINDIRDDLDSKSDNGIIYIPDNFFISGKEEIIKFEDMSLSEKIIKVFKNMTIYLEFRKVDLFESKRIEYKNLSFVQLLEECMRKVIMNSLQRYELNIKHKELLLLKLKKLENDSDEKNELKAQIKEIDKLLNAYSNGNILYGLDMDENETKKALNSINQSIKKLKNDG